MVTAGYVRRMLAGLLDTVMGLTLWALCSMWLILGVWAIRGLPRDARGVLLIYAGVLGLAVGLHFIYHVVLLGGCGQTVGRMALGIAVVRRGGGAPGYGRAALRSVGNALVVVTLGLAALVALFNRERRDMADLMSGTRVVRLG
ncbi:MAG TPA: RDD family protein [Methylomirabilota bacterium]|nr:RDD family protein [Methylomirabilota bacterium]